MRYAFLKHTPLCFVSAGGAFKCTRDVNPPPHVVAEIHYWAFTLLNYLVTKKKLSRMIVPVLASVLVASLVQYREDPEMTLKVTGPVLCLRLRRLGCVF